MSSQLKETKQFLKILLEQRDFFSLFKDLEWGFSSEATFPLLLPWTLCKPNRFMMNRFMNEKKKNYLIISTAICRSTFIAALITIPKR